MTHQQLSYTSIANVQPPMQHQGRTNFSSLTHHEIVECYSQTTGELWDPNSLFQTTLMKGKLQTLAALATETKDKIETQNSNPRSLEVTNVKSRKDAKSRVGKTQNQDDSSKKNTHTFNNPKKKSFPGAKLQHI